MSRKNSKHYTEEFKAQAVELLSIGKPVSEVAEELCVSTSVLYKWRHDGKHCPVGSVGQRAVGEKPAADDWTVLRRENALLRQENEILKKAAIILGTRARSSSER
jgi:transposase